MKLTTMLASMAAVCMLSSCEDVFEDGSMKPDGSKPSLTINHSTKNQSINSTEELQIDLTVVDKDEVNTLDFTVLSADRGDTVLNFSTAPHKTVVEFDTLLALPEVMPGAYIMKIIAEDNRTNVVEQEFNFTVESRNK
jgi:hypothetical protein